MARPAVPRGDSSLLSDAIGSGSIVIAVRVAVGEVRSGKLSASISIFVGTKFSLSGSA